MVRLPGPWRGKLSESSARICRSGAWLFAVLLISAFLPFAQMPWLWVPVIAISIGLTWLIFRDVHEMWFRGALDPEADDADFEPVESARAAPRAAKDPWADRSGFEKLDLSDLQFEDEDEDEDEDGGDDAFADIGAASAPSPRPGQLDFEVPSIPSRGGQSRTATAPSRPRIDPPKPAPAPREPAPARPAPAAAAAGSPGAVARTLVVEVVALRGADVELTVAADDGRSAGATRITADLEAALRFGDALRGFPSGADDRRDATLGNLDPEDGGGGLRLVLFQAGGRARVFGTIWPSAEDPGAPRQIASVAFDAEPAAVRAFLQELAAAVLNPGASVELSTAG